MLFISYFSSKIIPLNDIASYTATSSQNPHHPLLQFILKPAVIIGTTTEMVKVLMVQLTHPLPTEIPTVIEWVVEMKKDIWPLQAKWPRTATALVVTGSRFSNASTMILIA
jgi:hypothetical protein